MVFVKKWKFLSYINKDFQLALCQVPHRKHKKAMRKILVAGKPLNLGVRGPGEKPSRGETRSSGTWGSQPWTRVLISLRG